MKDAPKSIFVQVQGSREFTIYTEAVPSSDIWTYEVHSDGEIRRGMCRMKSVAGKITYIDYDI